MSKLLGRAKTKLHNVHNNYALMSTDDCYVDDCCYNLQQAIEMTLKYLVELKGKEYVTNHSIRAQLNILEKTDSDFIPTEITQRLRNLAPILEAWEAESRYLDSFVGLKADIDEALTLAETLIQFADSQVQTKESKDSDEVELK